MKLSEIARRRSERWLEIAAKHERRHLLGLAAAAFQYALEDEQAANYYASIGE